MGDILGAAAGCGMLAMIWMLVCVFFSQIGWMKRETVGAMGRVLLRCGLFALLSYGAIWVMDLLFFAGENMNRFQGMLRHGLFGWLQESPVPVRFFIQLQLLMMALAGMLVFFALQKRNGALLAMKAVSLFYLLPGMEVCFLPLVSTGFIPLGLASVIFLFRKQIRLDWMEKSTWVIPVVVVLCCLEKGCVIYRLVMGP